MSPLVTITTSLCEANSLFAIATDKLIALSLQTRHAVENDRQSHLDNMQTLLTAMKDIDRAIQDAKSQPRHNFRPEWDAVNY
jgi:hypothetical protein